VADLVAENPKATFPSQEDVEFWSVTMAMSPGPSNALPEIMLGLPL
jgi:hypothetical protein